MKPCSDLWDTMYNLFIRCSKYNWLSTNLAIVRFGRISQSQLDKAMGDIK